MISHIATCLDRGAWVDVVFAAFALVSAGVMLGFRLHRWCDWPVMVLLADALRDIQRLDPYRQVLTPELRARVERIVGTNEKGRS